jgi:hypothetical protein
MSLRLTKPSTAVILAGFALALLVAGCGGGSVKIGATVKALPTRTLGHCTTFVARQEGGRKPDRIRAYARNVCARGGAGGNWYHVKVTNEGRGATWVYCGVVAYDAHGRKLWVSGLPLAPVGFPYASVDLDPGKSSELTWFIPNFGAHPLRGPVARYKPICHAVKTPPV